MSIALSRLFLPSQDEVPPPIDIGNTPTITPPSGNFTYPSGYYPSGGGDMAIVGGIIILVIVGLLILWYYYTKRARVTFSDVRPSVADLSSKEVSLNRAALVQMIPYTPPLVGITPVLLMVEETPALALATLIGLISLPALMYFYMKNQSLQNNKGKVNLVGYMRTIIGDRFSYFWRNVSFLEERHLNEDEIRLIENAKILKATSVPSLERAAVVEGKLVKKETSVIQAELKEHGEGSSIEYDATVWAGADFEGIHAIPVRVNNRFDAYLLSKNLQTEWDFIDGEDYDYYGYHDVKISGPELREIATIHRVVEIAEAEYRDEYVPVFLVMYDDKMSSDRLKNTPFVDVTRDDAVIGITKAIGAEERTSAGELNSITEQVMVLENRDKELDDLSQTIGRKKALDFITAEKRLTMFDASMLGSVSTVVAVVFAVVTFLLGFAIGG